MRKTSLFIFLVFLNLSKVFPQISVTGVTISPSSASMSGGTTLQLTATVSPSNATNKNVTWAGGGIIVSSLGLVTAEAPGLYSVTVITADQGKTATCNITVTPASVTGVSISPTNYTLGVDATKQLTANVLPTYAANKSVNWTSNNSAVAKVSSSGWVTALAEGNTTITVTTVDGAKTAVCSVTVSRPASWNKSGTNAYYNSGNVGIGTSNDFRGLLTVNGKIYAEEIEVVSGINSDFVFEPEYQLMPLTDLEKYIKFNKHLPGIPSMYEFAKEGQNLAKTDDILLRKIEELTLYIIRQEEQIQKQNLQIEFLIKEVNILKNSAH